MKFSKFKTNTTLENEGVWVDIGDGATIRVARLGNPAYAKFLEKSYKPYRAQLKAGTLPDEIAQTIFHKALSKHVLLDWKGFTEDDDTPVTYSHDEAYKRLRANKDFALLVTEIASESAAYRDAEIEDEATLLGNASSGNTSGEASLSDSPT